jgi:hypothetical protein
MVRLRLVDCVCPRPVNPFRFVRVDEGRSGGVRRNAERGVRVVPHHYDH